MLPAPSEMKMLLFCVSKPTPVFEPIITLQAPVVKQHPELRPTAILKLPVVLLNKALSTYRCIISTCSI
jgi:hypothetical protein